MVCNSCCKEEEKKYKRGLWSPEEDNILESYILKYGHGYWSQVPKLAGLQRCGKSCRLRWINYLRPGLKRGSFSVQEQMTIINAHEIIGNRWSQIASMLPGRTDNEIKNLWHTHLKKKLKMNITNSDANAHKTFGEEPLVCSSTSPTNIEANDLQMGFPYSKDELDFQSLRSRLPVSLPMPLSTECSMMQSNNLFENGKPNPGVSKCLPNDNSLLGDLFCQWFTSDQKENPIIFMASKTSEISQEYPQSISDSENTDCTSYQSGFLSMSEEYPHSKEEQRITSSEFTQPGLQAPSANLPPFDNSLPFHENILCNGHSTTFENIADYWDIMNYNEIDMGIPCDSSFIENCYLLDSDFS